MTTRGHFKHRAEPAIGLFTLAIAALGASGCLATSRLSPSYFAETPQALERGHVAVVAVARGSFGSDDTAGGGSVRARLGVGSDQEIGVEASALFAQSVAKTVAIDETCTDTTCTSVTTANYGGKLSWKFEISPHAALIAGLGGTWSDRVSGDTGTSFFYKGVSLTGDLAGLFSWGAPDRSAVPYLGVRLSVGGPLQATNSASTTVSGNLGIGLKARLSDGVRFYLEGGPYVAENSISSWPAVGLAITTGLGFGG